MDLEKRLIIIFTQNVMLYYQNRTEYGARLVTLLVVGEYKKLKARKLTCILGTSREKKHLSFQYTLDFGLCTIASFI